MCIAYIGNLILDLWNKKCVFDFLVRKVRSVLKVRKVRTNQLWLMLLAEQLHFANSMYNCEIFILLFNKNINSF